MESKSKMRESKYQVSDTTKWMLDCIKDADELLRSFRDATTTYFGKGSEQELASFEENFAEMRAAMWEVVLDVMDEHLSYNEL